MGIYTRYATAVLVLFTSSAFSATRVPVKPTSETVITGARTGAISTPAGDVAFYGADKVYSFTAGDSVAPTVREVKSTVGTVSFPYGPEAAYPNGTGISSSATKIKVKPVAVVPKPRISTGLKNLVKTNPAQILLGVATTAAIAGVGWVMSPENTIAKKKTDYQYPENPLFYYSLGGGPKFPTVQAAYESFKSTFNPNGYRDIKLKYVAAGIYQGNPVAHFSAINTTYGNEYTFPIISHGSCSVAPTINGCPSSQTDTLTPLESSDFDSLDTYLNSQTASFLGDLLKDVCKASISPARCYEDMEDRSKRTLQGPATIAGPWFTKTSTFPKPDGTTGTKTETTSTKYDFTYGPEHFDVNPERKTTTTEDGLVTSETTETDGTPAEDVSDTPDEETPPEESYTFNDSELPAVEPFYTQKYPDGFQGVWDSANTDFEQSAFVSFLNSFVPSFSGSCPAFSMSFAIGGIANFGTHGFGNLCYALDFVKVCIMLGALFLCRAIVFGG